MHGWGRAMLAVGAIAAGAAALGGAGAAASTAKPWTCNDIKPSEVASLLHTPVPGPPSMNTSRVSGLTYLTCTFNQAVSISSITPATLATFTSLQKLIAREHAYRVLKGIGLGAFTATGSTTLVTTTGTKTKITQATTDNTWAYEVKPAPIVIEATITRGFKIPDNDSPALADRVLFDFAKIK